MPKAPKKRTSKKRSARPKTTEKTPVVGIPDGTPVGGLVPQAHGGAIRNGGTNIGGPGRPRNEWKEAMQALVSTPEFFGKIQTILDNPNHPQFVNVAKWASEHGYGKPDQHVTGSGAIVVQVVYGDEGEGRS